MAESMNTGNPVRNAPLVLALYNPDPWSPSLASSDCQSIFFKDDQLDPLDISTSSGEPSPKQNDEIMAQALEDGQARKTIAEVINGLNISLTQTERISALSRMLKIVSIHVNVQKQHENSRRTIKEHVVQDVFSQIGDEWIRGGAAVALCLKLGYIVQQHRLQIHSEVPLANLRESSKRESSNEVDVICSLLDIIYNACSDETRVDSFRDIGVELFPILFHVIDIHEQVVDVNDATKNKTAPRAESELLLSNRCSGNRNERRINAVLRTMRAFTKMECSFIKRTLVDLMSNCGPDFGISDNRKGVLSFLVEEITQPTSLTHETKLEALSIIKGLSFRVDVEVRIFLACYPGLVEALIDQISQHESESRWHGTNYKSCSKTIEYATATLWNLAIANETTDHGDTLGDSELKRMQEIHIEMGGNAKLVNALLSLLTDRSDIRELNGGEHSDSTSIKVRRNAISILGNLCVWEENKMSFVSFGNGTLLEAFIIIVKGDADVGVRRRALRTLRYLSIGSAWRAGVLASHRNLVEVLVDVALEVNDHDTRNHAIGALSSIALELKVSTTNPCVRESVVASLLRLLSTDCIETKWIELLTTALVRQTVVRETCQMLSDNMDFLNVVGKIARSTSSSNVSIENLTRVLANLCFGHTNLEERQCKVIVDVFAAVAAMKGLNNEQARINAVGGLVELGRQDSNRKFMAAHEDLTTALINFTLSSPEGDTKAGSKELIMKLVTSM